MCICVYVYNILQYIYNVLKFKLINGIKLCNINSGGKFIFILTEAFKLGLKI